MTTQHTPGPWNWQRPISRNLTNCLYGGGRPLLRCIDVSEADARLIAQAPAMLKALQRLTHPMADDEDLRDALAVIARATGQPVPEEDEGPEPPYAGYENQADLQRMAEVRRLEALRREGLIP